MSFIKLLAEGKISPAIDIYEVYGALFLGRDPEEAHKIYCDPESFFKITYITPGFRQHLEDFLKKLTAGESQIYTLPAMLGAGKSHFLALVLHIVALYKRCKGSGECVSRHLAEYGIELYTPTLAKVPNVAVFRAARILGELERRLRSLSTKEELREATRGLAPLVLLFDETQYLEEEPGFVQWIQTLAEVAGEVRGVYLFVSYSLFPDDSRDPALEIFKSLDAVKRVHIVKISLDTTENIVAVFRRWAGLRPRKVDVAPLKDVVKEEKLRKFEKGLEDAYPFNPVFLDIVLRLASESLAGRTRVQMTRELLRTLARAYVKASPEELVTFVHLPEPEDILVVGGPMAGEWATLLRLYREDVERLGSRAAVSVLRHILLATFLARLMPAESLYPTEDDLVAGSYNGVDIRPIEVREVLAKATDVGLHVARLGDRYLYWFVGDEVHAIREAMFKFSYEDGIDVVADQLASLLREGARFFSAVYVSGVGSQRRASGKVVIIPNRDEWAKALDDADKSTLAVDLMEFGVGRRRNNLFFVRRDDSGPPPADAGRLLERFVAVKNVKEAAVALGQLYKAVDEVLVNLYHYFPDVLSVDDERLRREMEQLLRSRVERWKERAANALRAAAFAWLRRVAAGFRDVDVKRLDEYLSEVAKQRSDVLRGLVEKIFAELQWDGFKKLGDLWSLYLNNEKFPPAPISFEEFVEAVKSYCAGCSCLFEVDGEVKWLSKSGCEAPPLDKDVGVAPLRWRDQLVDWAVEAFLKQLASLSTSATRYYVVYKRPSGEEVKRAVDELLTARGDWPFLSEGRLEVEVRERAVEVRIDGVATPVVERNPGSRLRVEVVGSDDLAAVIYRVGDVEREESASGRVHVFEVDLPWEPGVYSLEVEAVFRDGGRDRRRVAVNVKGRCRKVRTKYSVNVGEAVRGISVKAVKDARGLLDYFVKRGVPHRLAVRAAQVGGDVSLSVDAVFNVTSPEVRERAVRLLAALEYLSPGADVRFEFSPAVQIDSDMAQKFKGADYAFDVEVEEIC
ncbi:DUF499 domain-containing protein [Pyrobaculum sp. 3827-6]|uniref:DUF499 domain-containing protein n=1 Tax=Pyrobaculum sp. 3827-6 TaxID=2983604 RepID=UPI0021DB4324|nr:DUF499 domain-containing protein [Pyrobaculum sp. 3827-6]MCU7787512.1 DUF499 domain-containing protein [Pyrobaculum sp. 3827-6]